MVMMNELNGILPTESAFLKSQNLQNKERWKNTAVTIDRDVGKSETSVISAAKDMKPARPQSGPGRRRLGGRRSGADIASAQRGKRRSNENSSPYHPQSILRDARENRVLDETPNYNEDWKKHNSQDENVNSGHRDNSHENQNCAQPDMLETRQNGVQLDELEVNVNTVQVNIPEATPNCVQPDVFSEDSSFIQPTAPVYNKIPEATLGYGHSELSSTKTDFIQSNKSVQLDITEAIQECDKPDTSGTEPDLISKTKSPHPNIPEAISESVKPDADPDFIQNADAIDPTEPDVTGECVQPNAFWATPEFVHPSILKAASDMFEKNPGYLQFDASGAANRDLERDSKDPGSELDNSSFDALEAEKNFNNHENLQDDLNSGSNPDDTQDKSSVTTNGDTKRVRFFDGADDPSDEEIEEKAEDYVDSYIPIASRSLPTAVPQRARRLPRRKKHRTCLCCMGKRHVPRANRRSLFQRFVRFFACPPHGTVAKIVTMVVIGLMLWATFWALLGTSALPGGNFFGIVWVWIVSAVFGFGAELCHLPRFVGTLLGGMLSRNVPVINFGKDVDKQWGSALKKLSIVIVLIRAGLGVDVRALWRHKFVVARIGSVPMVIEGVAVAIASRFLLDMTWEWSFLAGFTVAPMSAAAAIPFMISFTNTGLGTNKGIPSMVQMGAISDNVLGLCVYSTFAGVVFMEENVIFTVLKLFPMQIAIAVGGGFLAGGFLWYIPHKNSKRKVLYRFLFLLGGCVVGAFATRLPQFSAVGPLANVIIAIVAAYKWRQQGWTRRRNPLIPIFGLIWIGTQIMLSGLIGALVDLSDIQWETVGIAIGVLTVGMFCRLLTQFLVTLCCSLNRAEQIFMTLAWIPKATIQAAVGSLAYDHARELKLESREIEMGKAIFILSVLAIVLWGCVGATSISRGGPHLLTKTERRESTTDRDDVKDACVQTGPGLLADLLKSHNSRFKRQQSFYRNYTKQQPRPDALYDPITKGMGELVGELG